MPVLREYRTAGAWRCRVSCYTVTVKNITVSVDDELYHRARVRAAELRTTVSALVREHLERLTEAESDADRLGREQQELIARIRRDHPGFAAADRLGRDEVHGRHAVR
jgi:post-segregation antitoxin (ccd killing protein)